MTEPRPHEPAGAQRWAAYLDWLREEAVAAVAGLPLPERRTSRLPSGWTPLEMLSHLAHMEQRWFVWGFLAEPVPAPWGDWDLVEPGDTGPQDDARWHVADSVDVDELADRLRAVGRRTTQVLTSHDLTEPARLGGRFNTDPPTLEWICFHVLAEYARHAGHLDVAVEITGG